MTGSSAGFSDGFFLPSGLVDGDDLGEQREQLQMDREEAQGTPEADPRADSFLPSGLVEGKDP